MSASSESKPEPAGKGPRRWLLIALLATLAVAAVVQIWIGLAGAPIGRPLVPVGAS